MPSILDRAGRDPCPISWKPIARQCQQYLVKWTKDLLQYTASSCVLETLQDRKLVKSQDLSQIKHSGPTWPLKLLLHSNSLARRERNVICKFYQQPGESPFQCQHTLSCIKGFHQQLPLKVVTYRRALSNTAIDQPRKSDPFGRLPVSY